MTNVKGKNSANGPTNPRGDRPAARASGTKAPSANLHAGSVHESSAVIHYSATGRVKLLEQPDELRDVIRGAMHKLLVNYTWVNGFPTISSRPAFVKPLLIDAARDLNAHKIKLCAKKDHQFSVALAPMVRHSYLFLSPHAWPTDSPSRLFNASIITGTS